MKKYYNELTREWHQKRAAFRALDKPLVLLIFFLTLTPFLWGLFYEFAAYFAGTFLALFLLYRCIGRKSFQFSKSLGSVVLGLGLLCYFLIIPFSVDWGMALAGSLKLGTIYLFLLVLFQFESTEIKTMLSYIPLGAVCTLLLSLLCLCIPATREWVFSNGRLGGFFQYANTFALYLLMGVVVLLNGRTNGNLNQTAAVFLVIGILLTGSRFVFVLTLLWFVYYAIITPKARKPLIVLGVITLTLTVAALALVGNLGLLSRFLTINFTESTFVGRLLYLKDGFKILLSRPFGLGYLGYYYIQPSVQTGEYIVRFIHNDWVQIALDAGLPALILMIIGLGMGIRKSNALQKQLFILIVIAGCFDFNTAFVIVDFILLLTLTFDTDTSITYKKWGSALLVIISLLYLYLGVAFGLEYIGNANAALALYPWNTEGRITQLRATTSKTEAKNMADAILAQNDTIALAYNAKATLALSSGNYSDMMRYQQLAIANSRYSLDAYETYLQLLDQAIQNANANHDTQTVKALAAEVQRIPEMLEAVKAASDSLAWQIDDVPQLDLSAQYTDYINALNKALK